MDDRELRLQCLQAANARAQSELSSLDVVGAAKDYYDFVIGASSGGGGAVWVWGASDQPTVTFGSGDALSGATGGLGTSEPV